MSCQAPLDGQSCCPVSKSRYEALVEGMTCIKCTEKIHDGLLSLNLPITELKIDFITNRVLFTIPDKSHLEPITQKLQSCGFGAKSVRDITASIADEKRVLTIKIIRGCLQELKKVLYGGSEALIDKEPEVIGDKCLITYNPESIRGTEIVKRLHDSKQFEEGNLLFSIENCFEEDLSAVNFGDFEAKQLLVILAINSMNIIISLLPGKYMTVPHSFGIFSYYFTSVLLLTILNLKYIGFDVYRTTFRQLLASSNVNMMTLVSLGSGLALIFGFLYAILGIGRWTVSGPHNLHFFIMHSMHMFHTSAAIFTSFIVGKYVEGRIKRRIYLKIHDLKKKLQVKVDTVQRIIPKNTRFVALQKEELPPLLVEKDDYISIQSAGMIPFDGFLEKGTVKVMENVQYGSEAVQTKTKGHPIISGSKVISVEGDAVMRVTAPLEKTLAGRLFYEIKEAASGSALGEKSKELDILAVITKYFITVVLIVAVLTLIGWNIVAIFSEEIDYFYPFEKTISVLVASCPCALGIAIPTLFTIALRKGFKTGVLIKDTASLGALQKIDTVVFDKTGTITGTYNVKEVCNMSGKYDDATLWELVSVIEKDHLQHPIGLTLFQEALHRLANMENAKCNVFRDEHDKTLHKVFASEGIVDSGIYIDGKQVTAALGNKRIAAKLAGNSQNVQPTEGCLISKLELESKIPSTSTGPGTPSSVGGGSDDLESGKDTTLFLLIGDEIQLKISLSIKEDLKANVQQVMQTLRKFNKDIQILSGDNSANAIQIGKYLGIPASHVHGEMDPEGKESYIKSLEESGKRVLMVGDGINDIKAFQAATLSCSINFKSSQNLTFADFIIINNDIETITTLFNLGSLCAKFKNAILFFALLYNVPVILAASGVLKSFFNVDLAAYMACWTMVVFSLFLSVITNVMELIDVKRLSIITPSPVRWLKSHFGSWSLKKTNPDGQLHSYRNQLGDGHVSLGSHESV